MSRMARKEILLYSFRTIVFVYSHFSFRHYAHVDCSQSPGLDGKSIIWTMQHRPRQQPPSRYGTTKRYCHRIRVLFFTTRPTCRSLDCQLDAVLVLGGGRPMSLTEPPLYVQRRCDDAATIVRIHQQQQQQQQQVNLEERQHRTRSSSNNSTSNIPSDFVLVGRYSSCAATSFGGWAAHMGEYRVCRLSCQALRW